MKNSIAHFPAQTQEELKLLVKLIRSQIPGCNMIILYGSYARNKQVTWDQKQEFGVHTSYQSDYDILIVISKSNHRITEDNLRHKVMDKYIRCVSDYHRVTPQFIVENISILNEHLERGQYFFTDIVQDGIMLFDDGACTLARPRQLDFKEIMTIAESEFKIYYPSAISMFEAVTEFYLPRQDYLNSAFTLHQVAEKFYYVIQLVCTNYRPKNHKLRELASMCKDFCRELPDVFPQDTPDEILCYDLLCRAYIETRYNTNYRITAQQLEYLIGRIEKLREITYKLCTEKIAHYKSLIPLSDDEPKLYPPLEEGKSRAADSDISHSADEKTEEKDPDDPDSDSNPNPEKE